MNYKSAYDYLLEKPLMGFTDDHWQVKLVNDWEEHQKKGVIVYWARFDNGCMEGEWEFAIICLPPTKEIRDHYGFPNNVYSVIDMKYCDYKGGRVGYLGKKFVEELNTRLTEGHFKKKFEEMINGHHLYRG